MNIKQEKFIDIYLQNGGNATQAAIDAGYNPKTAYSQGSRLLKKVEVAEKLKARLSEMEESEIAKEKEVFKFLTSVLRGEIVEKIPSQVGTGKGHFHSELLEKPPCIADRIKAASILIKYLEKEPKKEPLTIEIISVGSTVV